MLHQDVLSQASWARRSEASTRSHISDRASLISSVPGGPDNNEKLTPQQYGVLGKFLIKFIINNSDIILQKIAEMYNQYQGCISLTLTTLTYDGKISSFIK